MRNVKVKICGVTSVEDAQAAMDMGADLLGFNFVPESPRYLTVDQAAAIASLPSSPANEAKEEPRRAGYAITAADLKPA